jgi:hypothetical protein
MCRGKARHGRRASRTTRAHTAGLRRSGPAACDSVHLLRRLPVCFWRIKTDRSLASDGDHVGVVNHPIADGIA